MVSFLSLDYIGAKINTIIIISAVFPIIFSMDVDIVNGHNINPAIQILRNELKRNKLEEKYLIRQIEDADNLLKEVENDNNGMRKRKISKANEKDRETHDHARGYGAAPCIYGETIR